MGRRQKKLTRDDKKQLLKEFQNIVGDEETLCPNGHRMKVYQIQEGRHPKLKIPVMEDGKLTGVMWHMAITKGFYCHTCKQPSLTIETVPDLAKALNEYLTEPLPLEIKSEGGE